eukprot:12610715-Ditylum_brightwellii.AAC.1
MKIWATAKNEDTDTKEENDSATPRITMCQRAAAVAAMATIVEELTGPELPNQDDADGDLNSVPGPDDASNATVEGDDDFSLRSDKEEDTEEEADEYVTDEDPNHLPHTWWLPGAAHAKTPEPYQCTKEDA